jgi:hypothetical protein
MLAFEDLLATEVASVREHLQLLTPGCLTDLLCHRGPLCSVVPVVHDIVRDDQMIPVSRVPPIRARFVQEPE